MLSFHARVAALALAAWTSLTVPAAAQPPATAGPTIAIVATTVFDGTGRPPTSDATILIVNGRIAAVGPGRKIPVPQGARVIDGRGKFVIPGLINANAHLTPYNAFDGFTGPDSLLTLGALSASEVLLERGITTVRDTYGVLPPLLEARARLARGTVEGARILVAGNILGWGGPWSYSFSGGTGSAPKTPFERGLRDAIVQGMGEQLIDLSPDSLRVLLTRYISRGVDFVKIGVTTHVARPSFLSFSPRALEAMVATAHQHGRKVDAHAESAEGLRMAVLAGVDVLQHPETAGGARLPAELVDTLRARGTICALMPELVTGAEWARFQRHLELGGRMWPAEKPPAMMEAEADSLKRSGVDPRSRPRTVSVTRFENQRLNAESLSRGGCVVAVASDEVVALPGEKSGRAFGERFLDGVVGLVELGMTPGDALVSATRNGAAAAGLLDDLGTIAPGKRADLVILEADPLADIGNIRRVAGVIHGGRILAGRADKQ